MNNSAIIEYEPIAGALAGIEKYRGIVFEVGTPQGLKDAKAAHREVAAPRIALEKTRTKLKADVLERGRQIDGEARRIGALFSAIEDPIKAQIDAQERREEEARQAEIRAEQERLEAEARAKKEAEERALAEQRAEIARQRAALEAEERVRRAKLDEEERAARRRIEEDERKARAIREAADQAAKVLREAEETRLRSERARLEDDRRAADEVKRKEREAVNELADARTMLETFRKRFGHRPEFALVLEAIDDCLEVA